MLFRGILLAKKVAAARMNFHIGAFFKSRGQVTSQREMGPCNFPLSKQLAEKLLCLVMRE